MTIPGLSLQGKVAAVTGSRRGIGKAIALAFAEAGADVAVCDYVVDGGELAAVAEEIQRLGRRSLAVQADVTKKADVDNLVQRVEGELGAIDILANNAGISGIDLLSETPEEQWHKVIDVNLNGCFLCSRAVAERMIERKKGNIVSIASVEGMRGGVVRALMPPSLVPNVPTAPAFMARPYNISKAGIIMLTRVLARQLGSYGIRVNAIAPGAIKTDMIQILWSNPEILKQAELQIPLGRIAEPGEIASVALFLASDASSYITGHTILADGGLLA